VAFVRRVRFCPYSTRIRLKFSNNWKKYSLAKILANTRPRAPRRDFGSAKVLQQQAGIACHIRRKHLETVRGNL
jgi:hypothetical protein